MCSGKQKVLLKMWFRTHQGVYVSADLYGIAAEGTGVLVFAINVVAGCIFCCRLFDFLNRSQVLVSRIGSATITRFRIPPV